MISDYVIIDLLLGDLFFSYKCYYIRGGFLSIPPAVVFAQLNFVPGPGHRPHTQY